jgi:hypothetical protein
MTSEERAARKYYNVSEKINDLAVILLGLFSPFYGLIVSR